MAEVDLRALFPKALSRPIAAIKLDYRNSKYSHIRYGDQIVISGKPVNTIAKLQRHFWNTTQEFGEKSYQVCGSFPLTYKLIGSFQDKKNRIGNSVPPMFMRAIALQIKHVLWQGARLMPYPEEMSYLEILEQAWQDHLQPRADNAPTVISTFAGGGGSSLGYSMAGYRELLAVEWDDNAVATFKLNFPDVPVYHGDIAKLSVEECLELAGLSGPGELDLLDGSPPCQGFSTAGKRILHDPRNQLFREYIRLLRGLKPKVFVMENVSGLVKGKMKLVFVEILRELRASGYKVSARLMNAMYFYVPQSRQRLIFIGVREDLELEPSHPGAESRPIMVRECFFTGGDILQGIEYQRWLNIPPGGNWQDLPKNLVNGNAKYSNFHRKLHPCRSSYTVGKEEHYSSGRFYHWNEPRRINDTELKRIGSYPDTFTFLGNSKMLHYRIGNSVPPLFMRSIARHIKDNILDHTGIQPELIS